MWDLTLVEVEKKKGSVTVLVHDGIRFKIDTPKRDDWKDVKEGDRIKVSLHLHPYKKYAILYNMDIVDKKDFAIFK